MTDATTFNPDTDVALPPIESKSSFRVTRNAKGQIQFELKVVSVTNEPTEVKRAFYESILLTEAMIDKFPYGAPVR